MVSEKYPKDDTLDIESKILYTLARCTTLFVILVILSKRKPASGISLNFLSTVLTLPLFLSCLLHIVVRFSIRLAILLRQEEERSRRGVFLIRIVTVSC